jgi:hypothetical protein
VADHHVGCGQTADVTELSGDAEIGEQDPAFPCGWLTKQDVGGFDVAMQQSAGMRVVECASNGYHDLESVGRRHPGPVLGVQDLRCVGALHIVHRNPQLTLKFAAVVDADDVRVPQLGSEVRFPVKSLPILRVSREVGEVRP